MIVLNLLPLRNRSLLQTTTALMAVKRLLIPVCSFFAVVAAVLVLNSYMLKSKISDTQSQIQATTGATVIEAGGTLQENIRKMNEKLTAIKTVQDAHREISPAVHDLLSRIPEGISLITFSFDTELRSIVMHGVARTRDSLIAFRTEIEQIPYFADWKSPISDLTQRENIDFDFSATLTEDYLTILQNENSNPAS